MEGRSDNQSVRSTFSSSQDILSGASIRTPLSKVVPWLVAGAALVGSSCEHDELPTRPAPSVRPATTRLSGHLRHGAVAYLDSISASVPEFGGYFLDGQRNLIVYVTDSTKFGAARSVITSEIAHHHIRDKAGEYLPSLVLRKADFNFSQLQGWADDISDNVTGIVPGVVSSGVDLKWNRIRVGVDPAQQATAQSAVAQSLTALGIPPAAVMIETEQNTVSGPRQEDLLDATILGRRDHIESRNATLFTTTLSTTPFNPWIAGVVLSRSGCTGSLAVDYTPSGGSQHRYIMTASHCTQAWASVTPDSLFNGGGVTVLGVEAYDPAEPRYSDMAMYLVNASATVSRGTIARTFLGGSTTNIDTSNPSISVTGYNSSEVVGDYVMKVGVAGGWTDGYVDAINQTKVGNDGHPRYGTTVADYTTDSGDSGGPIFWPYASSANNVLFEGINWARYSRTCGIGLTCYGGYYSPVSGILSDLGASASQFNFTTEITISAPALSGSVVSGCSGGGSAPQLSWTASTVTGTSWPVQYVISAYDYYGSGNSSGWYTVTTLGAGTTNYQSTDCPVQAYLGTSPPTDDSPYTAYMVSATDSGVGASSFVVYFQW